MLVAGSAVASAALAFPAALPGDPHHRQCEQDSQHQQGDDTAYSYHKKDLSFERIPTPVYTICPRRATGKRCRLKLFSKNENLGLHLDQRSGIISTFRFGGLAQLVRAPASHAGGLGFESLILHHTVRTRTRFFMKKGLGTFFFIGSSAEGLLGTVNEQRQGITMIVVSCLLLCGIKFALCELGRPPIWRVWE